MGASKFLRSFVAIAMVLALPDVLRSEPVAPHSVSFEFVKPSSRTPDKPVKVTVVASPPIPDDCLQLLGRVVTLAEADIGTKMGARPEVICIRVLNDDSLLDGAKYVGVDKAISVNRAKVVIPVTDPKWDESLRMFSHELVHLICQEVLAPGRPFLNPWLQEGLAEALVGGFDDDVNGYGIDPQSLLSKPMLSPAEAVQVVLGDERNEDRWRAYKQAEAYLRVLLKSDPTPARAVERLSRYDAAGWKLGWPVALKQFYGKTNDQLMAEYKAEFQRMAKARHK
jgi:hypothetical protein